jgi:hypothetical protein
MSWLSFIHIEVNHEGNGDINNMDKWKCVEDWSGRAGRTGGKSYFHTFHHSVPHAPYQYEGEGGSHYVFTFEQLRTDFTIENTKKAWCHQLVEYYGKSMRYRKQENSKKGWIRESLEVHIPTAIGQLILEYCEFEEPGVRIIYSELH